MKGRKRLSLGSIADKLEIVVLAMYMVIMLFTFVCRVVTVSGQSMQDTLFENDELLVSRMFYSPKQGDIVVAKCSELDNNIVKRIIATEGQTVDIDSENAVVYVDGEMLDESYVKAAGTFDEEYFREEDFNEQKGMYEYKVPEGACFLMGDNRNHSTDSRVIGCVDYDLIIGRVIFRTRDGNDEGIGNVK